MSIQSDPTLKRCHRNIWMIMVFFVGIITMFGPDNCASSATAGATRNTKRNVDKKDQCPRLRNYI